jgi:hypothetical protein
MCGSEESLTVALLDITRLHQHRIATVENYNAEGLRQLGAKANLSRITV